MYISVNYRLSFFTFILGLQSNSSQTTVDKRNKVFHLHSKQTHPGFCLFPVYYFGFINMAFLRTKWHER